MNANMSFQTTENMFLTKTIMRYLILIAELVSNVGLKIPQI